MALSHLLDDSPLRPDPKATGVEWLYNERHRLALEELLSGGPDCFLEFLRSEKIPNFLSDDEIRQVRDAAVRLHGDDLALEQSLSTSADCSSVTYFPDVSDLEPPLLELGWPAFTAGSYRGVTRAVAHFQPGSGGSIYGCKEAARRMIQSAREVIAIVTDSLTDLDVFKDLQEACTSRHVPVYVLLDQSSSPAFLKMCRSVGVCLDDLQHMRVRTVTGTGLYMRSGVRITGKVHERFMLIDGNRVATGSYRFNWTDGKLNSSNLLELSGQVTEKFDEEFRVLYAQSSPIGTRLQASLPLPEPSVTSPPQRLRRAPCLSSTPARRCRPMTPPLTPEQPEADPAADASAADRPERVPEDVLAADAAPPAPVAVHASTQTAGPPTDALARTELRPPAPDLAADQKGPGSPGPLGQAPPELPGRASSHGERQRRYAAIRAKLENMVAGLAPRPQQQQQEEEEEEGQEGSGRRP